jgi:glycine/D-amino acid oxidase-like deaminating enzyme
MPSTDTTHQVVIIGSGPAGLTAAVYAARANLEPLLIEGLIEGGPTGGQLTLTTDVENYPGFPDGIMGPQLISDMRAQAGRFGTTFITEDVIEVDASSRPFQLKTATRTTISTQALIVATGAKPRRLEVPGEDELWGAGVSACHVRRVLLPRPARRGGRRRRLRDGGSDLPDQVRLQGDGGPPAPAAACLGDHAGAGVQERQDRVRPRRPTRAHQR